MRELTDSDLVIGTWPPAIVCCRERELCVFEHGGDFMITGDPIQLARAESRINGDLSSRGERFLVQTMATIRRSRF